MRHLKAISLLFIAATLLTAFTSEISEKIAAAIKTGNSKEIASYFNSSVDLTVVDKEDVYSKIQAELILKDFFVKNPPKSFTIIHQGTSKLGLHYVIGNLITANGNFRVSFYIKKENSREYIQQMRIDPEN